MTAWRELFERAETADVDLEELLESHRARREEGRESVKKADEGTENRRTGTRTGRERASTASNDERDDGRDRPNPARVVADADVLAADLLVGGDARAAVDHVRRHSWVELVASDPLVDETEALVAAVADPDLAAAHRERLEADRVRVEHPEGDHPALASAHRGGAAHVLSYDDRLRSAKTGLTLQPRLPVSVRPPDAFARLFDAESLYEAVGGDDDDPDGGEYPGPDRDPRS